MPVSEHSVTEGYKMDETTKPIEKVEKTPSKKTKTMKGLTPTEVEALFKAIPAHRVRDRVAFRLMCECGLRIGEVVGGDYEYTRVKKNPDGSDVKNPDGTKVTEIVESSLPGMFMQDIDWKNKMAWVTGKGNKQRRIVIMADLLKDIALLVGKKKGNFLLITTYDGKPMTDHNLRKIFHTYCKKAGIMRKGIHPHDLRHTFGRSFIRKDGNVMVLQKLMGHVSISTTQIYAELDTEEAAIEAKKILCRDDDDICPFCKGTHKMQVTSPDGKHTMLSDCPSCGGLQ